MTELAIALEPADADFVAREVAAGRYADSNAVVHVALSLLQGGVVADAAKEARYRALVETGLDQADRGEAVRIDDVRGWLDGLGRQRSPA